VAAGNEPVGQREFDRYADDVDRRLGQLEEFRRAHEQLHERERQARAKAQKQKRDNAKKDRRWSREQIAAWAAVAAVLVAAWLTSTGK